ncbi:MAG: ATPase, T2SS/T4P/T4SS family [Planctomycetota bacterium]
MFTLPRMGELESGEPRASFGAMKSSVGNLPLKQLGYETRVVGLVARTTITQTYYNLFDECIEATYVFPIEGEHAVIDCELLVGDRVVRAKLKERGQARADYQNGIAEGHRAALMEENRSETFSMRVGNIPPGEAVRVRMQTIGHLPVVRGEWMLRLPLVVAPRYTSGYALPSLPVGSGIASDTDQVPDASAVSPPTWLPGFASPVDLSLSVEMDMSGLTEDPQWARHVCSSLHAVLAESSSPSRFNVFPGERVNRDFILRGRLDDSTVKALLKVEPPVRSNDPKRQTQLGSFAINIVPPKCNAEVPRDVVFLLDRSGSMGGWKMDAARRGTCRLIDTLTSIDRFQVVAFDHELSSPFDTASPNNRSWIDATNANRFEAIRWLGSVDAQGGTEMGRAIESGLQAFVAGVGEAEENTAISHRSPAVVLVTDGQITGEDSVLRLLGTIAHRQRPRFFCLGVDRAVNASILKRITDFTDGVFELVESEKRLDQVMGDFADELGSPAITNFEATVLGDADAQRTLAPSRRSNLYSGRCFSVYGRACVDEPLRVALSGQLAGGESWSQELIAEPIASDPINEPSLLPMWGRRRIRELEDSYIAKGSIDSQTSEEILSCSLECGVLSRFTAFVAIDDAERVAEEAKPHRINQPIEYPEGWQGRYPRIASSELIPAPGKPQSTNIRSSFRLAANYMQMLVDHRVISSQQFDEVTEIASGSQQDIDDVLTQRGYATADDIARAIAESYQLPYIDLTQVRIDEQVVELVPESVVRENSVLPYAHAPGELTVVTSDPNDLETIEKLRFILNTRVNVVVSSADAIHAAINQYYGQVDGETADSMLQEFTDTAIDFTETESSYGFASLGDTWNAVGATQMADTQSELNDDICQAGSEDWYMPEQLPVMRRSRKSMRKMADSNDLPSSPDQGPIIRLTNLLIAEAVQLRATHVILRPIEDALLIVFVIDGVEVEREQVPDRLLAAVVARLKILSKVDLSVSDRLQSGELPVTVGDCSRDVVMHFAPRSVGAMVLIDFVSETTEPPVELDDLPGPVKSWWEDVGVRC